MKIHYQAGLIALTVSLAVAGCGGGAKERDHTPQADAEREAVQAPAWTAGIIDRPRPDLPTSRLVAVRTGTHDGLDRVVFEFDERVPGYHIAYLRSDG